MRTKLIMILCLLTLIGNAVFFLPSIKEITYTDNNSVKTENLGIGYCRIWDISSEKQGDKTTIIITKNIDYQRLIFHSTLILLIYSVFYVIFRKEYHNG